MMFKIAGGLIIVLVIGGLVPTYLLIVPGILLATRGFRGMYKAKQNVKAHGKGHSGSGTAATTGIAGAAATGAFASSGATIADDATFHTESPSLAMDEMAINPANGMPMVGSTGGIDIEGNPYGTDSNPFADDHDVFSASSSCGLDDSFSAFDDDIGCGIDDSMSSGFDDW